MPKPTFTYHHESAAYPPYIPFASRRSVVYSSKGMVACTQPQAAEAGLEILRKGGNAADAAVAVSAMLNFTEPSSCGIGGDTFCLYYDAKTKKVSALNGSGRAPAALSYEKAIELGGVPGEELEFTNINSATVPGCAAAWVDTIEQFGSGKVTVAEALEPAIKAAERGVPISEISSYYWDKGARWLRSQSENGDELLIKDPVTGKSHAPRPGEIFKNPNLAATFRALATEGKKGFYEGRIAQAIVDLVQSKGGVMTLEDLKSHSTTSVEPITYSYGGPDGVTLHECPPNGQGIIALIALGIIEQIEESGKVDLTKAEHNGAIWLHTLIEAIRLAFADAHAYVADPEKAAVPVKELLSKEYLKKRAALFNPEQAIEGVDKGMPFASSDTVLFCTADEEGNACSYIQSNYAGFGTYAVPKGTGFSLQNRGTGFKLEKGHPNCVAGGKRPYHTIIPALVTKGEGTGGDLLMTYGVMGRFMQPQGHVQVLLNMIRKGMTPQAALDSPRFCISASPTNQVDKADYAPDAVSADTFVEEGISPEVIKQLTRMGHKLSLLKGWQRGMFGKGQVIQRLPNGVWAGGSDLRGDGHAVPQL
ncbi:gamma-glutamyltranspeptidase [Meredithblackwellia eburnea MCA 4105]